MTPSDLENDTSSRRAEHPPGYKPNMIHIALIVTDMLAPISPAVLTPAWIAAAAIACWPWGYLRIPVAALSLILLLVDGISLALLPRQGRSFGPVTPSLLALTLIRTMLIFAVGLLWNVWHGLLLITVLNFAIVAASIYATWIEPFQIQVTQAELRSPKLNGHAPLRLLHISDLHVEHVTIREEKLIQLVKELAPDVIILTGDYLTLSSVHNTVAQTEAYNLLSRLCDIDGPQRPIYAITGSPPVDHPDIVPDIFGDLPITWLLDATEEIHINGHDIRLSGLCCTAERHRDVPRLYHLMNDKPTQTVFPTPFTLLLYHSPDLMPEATELGIDLYLCGHTHGGQIRLPIFGAVFTSSDFGKQYEMGRYEKDHTTLYVSRGIGMEGLGAPRARFLAPPEIILWTLSSS
ncbi:MAG: metallophosphoesterase [Chloroflexi bacterium]|nr:metallophosphoesterase [Chloroflexota bacterium]